MINLSEFFSDYTLRNVSLGALILGFGSGALGCFALLRRQSLLGDAVSHAALPGIVLAFIISQSKLSLVLLAGAGIAGLVGTLFILGIIRSSKLDADSAQGIVLSVFFGLGLMLLTWVQKLPNASQSGLDRYLFGQAATIVESDLLTMAVVEGVALLTMLIFWKEFKLLSFDPGFGTAIGLPRKVLDIALTGLIVVAIVIGLSMVGVILMSAMLVAPAVAARQWTDKLGSMVALAAVFGALAGLAGSVVSASIANLPTGPVVVLILSAISAISLLFSPHRGLLSKILRRYRIQEKTT